MSVVSSLEVVISANNAGLMRGLRDSDRQLGNFAQNFGQRLQGLGSSMTRLGASLGAFSAPIVGGFALAVNAALGYEEQLTNIRSITGQSEEEFASLATQIAALGDASKFGRDGAVAAMYDIVGGVQDADSWMAILTSSINLAEAGNANLAATTSGLISVMNSYGLGAEDAAGISDILTQAVKMGVGTMDEFTAALGPASGLAYDVGIGFDELASATAFLTSTGQSASEATTQLTGIMTAFLNPNAAMEAALAQMGFASGEAALEQLGLVGAVKALGRALGGDTSKLASAFGRVEALSGAVGLLNDRYDEFSTSFEAGTPGATEAAQAIQMEGAASQFAVLQGQIRGLAIEVGSALLPALQDLFEMAQPVIASVIEWVRENPQLVAQIGVIAGAVAGLAAVLIPLGLVIGGIGTIIGLIASPIGIVIAAVAALAAAYATNFGGIRDFIDNEVRPRIEDFFAFLGQVWEQVRPALESVFNWFVTEALPGIVTFVQDTVLPAVQDLFNFIGGVWELVRPALESIFNWFMTDALPGIRDFLEGPVKTAVEGFISILQLAWDTVRPGLEPLFAWFSDTFTRIEEFIREVIRVWDELMGRLQAWQGIQANANTINAGLASGQWTHGDVLNAGIGAFLSEIGLRAAGGPVSAGSPYIVGEQGSELFIPSRSGMIVPHDQLRAGVGGGPTYHITIQMPAEAIRDPALARRRGAEFGDAFMQRMRERG